MKYSILLVLALLLLASTASATGDQAVVFQRVDPDLVDMVNITLGVGVGEWEFTGDEAQAIITQAMALHAAPQASTRIQHLTWNWSDNTPRADFTPLKWRLAVRESFTVDVARQPVVAHHYTTFSCFVVFLPRSTAPDPDVYGCWRYEGSSDFALAYHFSFFEFDQTTIDSLFEAVLTGG
jgi:hypothetical protein